MTDKLKNKKAVVTGAGRGIGKAVSLLLAEEGADVVVVDPGGTRDGGGRDQSAAEAVVSEIKEKGGNAVASLESVSDFDGAERIINTCLDSFGRIDILVNCAGILRERMIFNMPPEDFDSVIKVHLYGTWNCMRHASSKMREQKYGRIINFTSDAWRGGGIGQCNYAAAKGAISSLTYTVARELGKYGVTVNSIAPMAATRMTADEGVKAGMKKRYEAGLISKKQLDGILNMPGPEFIAPVVAYLASDVAADINGQIFHVEKERVGIYSMPEEVRILYQGGVGLSIDELEMLFPGTLLTGYVNPAPSQVEK